MHVCLPQTIYGSRVCWSAFPGIDYKIWLVMSQTAGYTLSKFFGIKFIAELKNKNRTLIILKFIGIAWVALLFFSSCATPYNIIFLLINGFL